MCHDEHRCCKEMLNHYIVHLKLILHCMLTILELKKNKKTDFCNFVSCNIAEFTSVLCHQQIVRILLLSYQFLLCSLIAVARASTTMVNKIGENGHLCMVPDLPGE